MTSCKRKLLRTKSSETITAGNKPKHVEIYKTEYQSSLSSYTSQLMAKMCTHI
jgi:hypothetical protein